MVILCFFGGCLIESNFPNDKYRFIRCLFNNKLQDYTHENSTNFTLSIFVCYRRLSGVACGPMSSTAYLCIDMDYSKE